MINRREFLTAGGAFFLHMRRRRNRAFTFAALPGGTLDPTTIPKYTTSLFRLPAMPGSRVPGGSGDPPVDNYQLAIRQFGQQVLPLGYPTTTVWGYGDVHRPNTFHWPAFTVEARTNTPVRVKWINGLVDSNGDYLPHILPVDPTIHWANPPGGLANRDSKPEFTTTPGRYTGPVPIVSHLHGAHSREHSDGYPEAWFLPAAGNIPAGFAAVGSFYKEFKSKFGAQYGVTWEQGTSTFQYENDQAPTTLWYHDHSLGITRVNVYAGLAGFYLIREPDSPGRAGRGVAVDLLDRRFEAALMIQDRSFNADGSLFYPDSRFFFDGFGGPYIPTTDTPPIWNPEFFANTMTVNGNTWPVMEVEPRRYRLRLVNSCNSRFLILKMVTNPLASRPASPVLPFWQIGADGGFLPAAVQLDQLLMALAERADVIVDFSQFREGDEIYLINEGPDEPFGGGVVGSDFAAADPQTTGQVMKFKVVRQTSPDFSPEPSALELPSRPPLGAASLTRPLSLNEMDTTFSNGQGPVMASLGTMAAGMPVALRWGDAMSENPQNGATEVWELYNFTEDAHPIHVHLVQFEVINRQPLLKDTAGEIVLPVLFAGPPRSPEEWETGRKDTLIAYPGEVTRLKAKFDVPGLFVWHCHILEHEDNEMMRPYRVV